MTFEKMVNDLSSRKMNPQDAFTEMSSADKRKRINYYAHVNDIRLEPLTEPQLQELNAIVRVLQILYDSPAGSPVSDTDYDVLQETLVNMGIPRSTGSIEINDSKKISHKYTQLRGTLGKVYYLRDDEPRVNKSQKSLDEWLNSMQARYRRITGMDINPGEIKVLLQPKFDGVSSVMERDIRPRWITRGDTDTNRASDISHVMNIFNDVYGNEELGTGIQFESMIPEDALEKINTFYPDTPYRNSRQVVVSMFGASDADFKADYLYPVPLRIIRPGDDLPQIHPDLIAKFPTEVCTFNDRDVIAEFARNNKFVNVDGHRFRTDGAVMTILDPELCKILGRENNINQYEVAYKFTAETAYTKVKDIEFYVSEFAYITPVLVVNPVIMKGNTINRISLSNKERFDELNFSYGDTVKVLYDIIPYATVDEKCQRVKNGRKINFITECPRCHEPLDLNAVEVQCKNPRCPSRLVGRVVNYCATLRIKNIGYRTLDILYSVGLLNNGIRSLYQLKKHVPEIEFLDGFGKLKTKKILAEIEAKRTLNDYDFFGAMGIEGLKVKTFKQIFARIKLEDFLNMIHLKNFGLLEAQLMAVKGISSNKAADIVGYFQDPENAKELKNILKEIRLVQSYGTEEASRGKIVFTKCRPTPEVEEALAMNGWEPTASWSNSAKILVIPHEGITSGKVSKALDHNIPIMTMDELLDSLK
ncbi:MAG: hypothetical protein NC131_11130 [Roseburia sp.]|nr:hypothetical protein [Roseburia sp.]